MKKLNVIIFLTLSVSGYPQEIFSYDWEEEPEKYELTEEELKEPQVTLKYLKKSSFFFKGTIGRWFDVSIEHKIIRLNNDEGIENNNKVYLPTYNFDDLKVYKARIIYPDGKIRELEDEDLLEVKDDDGNVRVLYYAIEGVEKGVDIEFIFGRIQFADLNGERVSVQDQYSIRNAVYIYKTPENLKLNFKTYNGLPEFKKSEEGGNNVYTLDLGRVEALEKEDFSVYESNVQAFHFKGYKNSYSGRLLARYNDINDQFNEQYYQGEFKEKDLVKFLEPLALDGLSEEDKIRKVESHLKNNYFIHSTGKESLKEIFKMKEKVITSSGIMNLFISIFKHLDIEHELVVTSDRYGSHFDKDFESYYYLSDFLFKFTKTGLFMDPYQKEGRYPYVDDGYFNNYGLFFKTVNVGEVSSLISDLKRIAELPPSSSYSNVFLNIDISDLERVNAKIKLENFGYFGNEAQGLYEFMDDESKKETKEEFLKFMDKEGVLTDSEMKNVKADDIGVKPLVVTGNLSSSKLIETAGNNYLFKIGETIGKQSNLYDKEKRVCDIELHYLHDINREIKFNIPEGYWVKNLKDLELSVQDDSLTMGFVSSYKMDGNTVTVTVKEYFHRIMYKKELYPQFRRVINAAADFNKVALILEKR